MKKGLVFLLMCILPAALLFAGCGGKYSDVKKVNAEYVALVQRYVDDLEKVTNAKDAAKAIDRFVDGMQDLWPKMKALAKKYPELKDRNKAPEELKELQAKAQEMGRKMGAAMRKLMPYMQDPEVQKAQKRLQAVMTR